MKQVSFKITTVCYVNDLYQNRTYIMKQAKSKLLHHDTDLYQKVTCIMKR